MRTLIFLSILFSAIVLPAHAELTSQDLDKIRLIVKEEVETELSIFETRIKEYIDLRFKSVDKQFETIDNRFESVDKQFESVDKQFEGVDKQFESVDRQITHVTYITYGLIALIVAAIAIPQILISWRSGQDRSLERQVEILTEEVETLKQQKIVSP